MDNVFIVTLLLWPLVVLVCAGINMLVSWTVSWTELVLNLLMGMVAGFFLWGGSQSDPHGAVTFFFVFSHGLIAWIYAATDGFGGMAIESFIWLMAALRIGATLWSAAFDHLSVRIGSNAGWGSFIFSLVLAPAKLPFALITGGIGLLIWLAAAAKSIYDRAKGKADPATVSFAGGIFVAEFAPGGHDYQATTLGFTSHAWLGDMPFKHELYHTRQYIYYGDWLVPFWLLGALWGLVARVIAGDKTLRVATHAYAAEGEVGNPLEVAAYRLA